MKEVNEILDKEQCRTLNRIIGQCDLHNKVPFNYTNENIDVVSANIVSCIDKYESDIYILKRYLEKLELGSNKNLSNKQTNKGGKNG